MIELTKPEMAELDNIKRNGPVFLGDTLSHQTAARLAEIGLIRRNSEDYWVPAARIADA